jgi:hypothetical protein
MLVGARSSSWLAAMALGLHVLANLLMHSDSFPFSPDSTSYIEQARSLASHGAALVNPYELEENEQSFSTLFPIGFPLILSLFQILGIDARESSVALSWLSSIALPFILYLGFRGALGNSWAIIFALLSISSPGFIAHSGMGLTDVFSLLLASTSIALIISAKSRMTALAAGMLAGIAYSVRNAHAALLISQAVYFAAMWLSDRKNRRELASVAQGFTIGAAAIIIPLIFRNFAVFGALNPYSMEPSTVGVLENIRTYLQEFVYEITGHREAGRVVAWSVPGLFFSASVLCLLAWIGISSWDRLDTKQRKTLLLCSVYSIVGACVVIAARSRYQWGEPINVRHTMQYVPFFFAALSLLAAVGARSSSCSAIKYTSIIAIVSVLSLHGFRMIYSDSQVSIRKQRSNSALSAYISGRKYLCATEKDGLLVSNYAYVFRINCNSPVQQWSPVPSDKLDSVDLPSTVITSLITLSERYPKEKMTVGLYFGRKGVDRNSLTVLDRKNPDLKAAGWTILVNDGEGFLVYK